MKQGDKVIVHMSDNCFGVCNFEAVIQHAPSDTGDSWYLHATIYKGREKDIVINPQSSAFVGFELVEEK